MSMQHASPLGKLRIAVIICCLVLILGIIGCAYLSDKNTSVLDKDKILDNVDNLDTENLDYSYLSSYIKKYGVGNINSYKINEAESKIRNNFYKELPDRDELSQDVVSLFVEHFYDKIDLNDKTAVTDAVLTCLLSAIGDPWAYYRTADEFLDYSNSLDGGEEFVGIGIQVKLANLEITMVYKDSGADEAGIKPGDILYGVEDKTVEDTSAEDLMDMIKGEPDTMVKIVVKRGEELLEFNVKRTVLTEKTVFYNIDSVNNIGRIQILQFLGTTPLEFAEAVDFCTESGVKALVIDVRSNPGGLLDSVVAVIDYLVPDAPDRRIGSYTQNGQELVYYTGDNHSVNLPIAVICNQYTASAGELFTGAMRDYGDAGVLDTVIVGSNTYGKGVAQSSFFLHDGSALTFTIGYFNPPCNVNFDGVGVAPDFEVLEVQNTDAPLATAIEKVLELVTKAPATAMYYSKAA